MNREGFIVREFTTKIDPPASLTAAINAKNEAVQNALLVQQYAIEKWNGELPTSNGSNALPFINLK